MLHGIYGSVSLSASLVGRNTKETGTLSARPLKHVIQKASVQRLLPHIGHSRGLEGTNSCALVSFPEFLCFLDITANLLVWSDGLMIGTRLIFLA